MTNSAWWLLALAMPVLLLGEFLVKKITFLSRYNIPAPVVGGLLVSLLIFAVNATGISSIQFTSKVDDRWWTWLITTEIDWRNSPKLDVHRPFLVGFFTCIGLNASWDLARRGGWQVIVFLITAAVLAFLQNILGVLLAKLMGVPLLLGIVCGSLTMTGGHATALGFAADFEKAGLAGASVIGAAAATFGLVAGGLLGGPLGGGLIRRHKLKSAVTTEMHLESGSAAGSGILKDFQSLKRSGAALIWHLVLLLVCIKAGTWLSYFIQKATVPMPSVTGTLSPWSMDFTFQQQKLTFPVYMGALLLGVLIRNVADLLKPGSIKTEVVDTLGSVNLGIFLSVAMMSLNLIELQKVAVPMLVILTVQVLLMALFAWLITFRIMGRDFDAAVMAGGHCGFGLGATPNAVANMKSLVETFGPAPRAFLVVPIVGAFLLDFFNAINITFFLNAAK
jgi:glutamate:Na+ symporter, ESS family